MEQLHQQLQQISQQINAAQEDILRAQGSDLQLIEEAELKIQQAHEQLKMLQNQNGTKATENAQFQQAFEELHDVRQQIQEAQQNNNDIL